MYLLIVIISNVFRDERLWINHLLSYRHCLGFQLLLFPFASGDHELVYHHRRQIKILLLLSTYHVALFDILPRSKLTPMSLAKLKRMKHSKLKCILTRPKANFLVKNIKMLSCRYHCYNCMFVLTTKEVSIHKRPAFLCAFLYSIDGREIMQENIS